MAAVRLTHRGLSTRTLVFAPSALLVCAGLVAGAASQQADLATPGLGSCVRFSFGDTVEELNHEIDVLVGVPEFLGADVGVDVWLSEKRSLWLFADTLQRTPSGEALVRNSMLLVTPGCIQVVERAGGGAVVPDRGDGVGYWPTSVWKLDRGGATTVFAMFQRVEAAREEATSSGFGFVTLGPALVVFRVAGSGAPQAVARVDLGADDPSQESPEWGAAAALDGGWLYLDGRRGRVMAGTSRLATTPMTSTARDSTTARARSSMGSSWFEGRSHPSLTGCPKRRGTGDPEGPRPLTLRRCASADLASTRGGSP